MTPEAEAVALKLRVLDSQGNFLSGKVNLELRHMTLSDRVVHRDVDASKEIAIAGLRRAPTGNYQLTVDPEGKFRPQSIFINIPASGFAIAEVVFQQGSDDGSQGGGGTGTGTEYTVTGTVSSPDSAGVAGLRVRIVDKNAGGDTNLSEAVTDDRGRYQAKFHLNALESRRKQVPDLQARVFAGDTFLGASEIRFDASPKEVLDVQLPAKTQSLAAEHEALTGSLARHFDGHLRDLQENDQREDITYLANKTGWDARAVALAALADQFSTHSAPAGAVLAGIAPAFYYALFRAGLPSNPDTLYQSDSGTVERVWKEAINQGVIPKALEAKIPQALQTFTQLTARSLLDMPAPSTVSALKDMLAVSRLNADQQQRFASLYAEHRNDRQEFWNAIGRAFGTDVANRLQVDGKLAFLTLNNAPVMLKLQGIGNGITDPVQLAQAGLFRPEAWQNLIADAPIPDSIPGATPEIRKANYAAYLAAEVRISYPTAAVAEMVRTGDLPVKARDGVRAFLTEHQGKFEIAAQPVQQYIAKNKLQVDAETVGGIKQLQRVYQITPNDRAMGALLNKGIESAYQVTRFEKGTFTSTFAEDFGGEEYARQAYDKAAQVHNAVLNLTMSYLTAKTGVPLGSDPMSPATANGRSSGTVLAPSPHGPLADNADDIIAYPTLEGLFGSMDFCTCDHCRSLLSPAAYLVDLLYFIDQPAAGAHNPQAVLFGRRPDIQHLPLTCENTNTVLPYIDIVNETLEYFIANTVQQLSLNGYQGHDTGKAATEDLLASPQYVMDSAYTALLNESFPPPLPFHQALEALRRYFEKFETPLPESMERLRTTENLERGGATYGWRDIQMERIRLSRAEYQILTDSTAVPLWRMYGFASGTADADVIAAVSNAKAFSRRVGISYEDVVAILRTRFINPDADLIPKLEALGVSLATIAKLKAGTISGAEFDAMLPAGAGAPDPAAYANDIKGWVTNDDNFNRIMGLIVLTDPTGSGDTCNFDNLEFRHARPISGPGDISTRLTAAEFVRMLRFIRLWKKTGWTIEQTDAAICALFRADLADLTSADVDTLAKLDAGFLTLLPRLGIIAKVMQALNLNHYRLKAGRFGRD